VVTSWQPSDTPITTIPCFLGLLVSCLTYVVHIMLVLPDARQGTPCGVAERSRSNAPECEKFPFCLDLGTSRARAEGLDSGAG
jgi:hypothetical protein